MALSTRKRPRASLVKQETVGHAISFLEELPEKTKEDLSLREAVGQMQEQIKAALDKGYNYDEIAKMLSEKGIRISALTLKNYAPSGRRQAGKGKTKRPRKTADNPFTSGEDTSSAPESTLETNGASDSEPDEEATATRPRRGRRKTVAAEAKTDRRTSTRSPRSRNSTATEESAPTPTRRRRKSKDA